MGGYREMTGAPLDYSGMLDDSMRGSARVSGLDASYADAAAQKGGRRNRRNRSRNNRSRNNRSRNNRSRSNRSRNNRSRNNRSRNNRSNRNKSRRMQRGGYSPAEVTSPTLLLSSYAGTGANLPPQVFDQRASPYSAGADAAMQRAMQGGSRRRNRNRQNRSRQNRNRQNRSRQNRNRRQRGGFAPVDQRSMLLTDYSKAGLPEGFSDPLLKN
jgi:hypothetical protein